MDIIKVLNNYIKSTRKELAFPDNNFLVLHKEIKSHSTFKVYKEFIYTLYSIKGKNKSIVFTLDKTFKCTKDNEDSIRNSMEEELLTSIYKWIHSNDFDKYLKEE